MVRTILFDSVMLQNVAFRQYYRRRSSRVSRQSRVNFRGPSIKEWSIDDPRTASCALTRRSKVNIRGKKEQNWNIHNMAKKRKCMIELAYRGREGMKTSLFEMTSAFLQSKAYAWPLSWAKISLRRTRSKMKNTKFLITKPGFAKKDSVFSFLCPVMTSAFTCGHKSNQVLDRLMSVKLHPFTR